MKSGLFYLLLHYLMQIPIQWVRHSLLRQLGMYIDPTATIYMGTEIRNPTGIRVGAASTIGHNCVLDGRAQLRIGDNVNLSSEVMIWTVQHDPQDANFGVKAASVSIEDFAWVSTRSIVLPGVTVGRGAVVAAGSVVTKSVEPFTIVAGIPAKKIGDRTQNLSYKLGQTNSISFV